MKINRLILWLALAGMLLAVHLWIQKARGFDQGCLGLTKPEMVVGGGCHEVDALPASHLFGVSNAAWGFAFYFGTALLALAKVVFSARWTRGLHRVSELASGGGLAYSGYLVFTMLVVHHLVCLLCLGSAVLVLTLFVLHVAVRVTGGPRPPAENARATEIGFAGLAVFAATGMLVVIVLFVNRIGTRPLGQGETALEFDELFARTLPAFIDSRRLDEMRACRLDPWTATLDVDKLVPPATPFIGKADGVSVIAFFDPNCPYCAAEFPQFMQLAERHKDRARFIILPRLLGGRSLVQTESLMVAESSGKYYELWKRLLAPREPGHVRAPQIAVHFRALGLDATDLEQRLDAAKVRVERDAHRYTEAGIRSTPVILIGGKRVSWWNLSPECLGRLIEDELAAAPAEK